MNTNQQLEIVQAKADGKTIEFRRLGREGANGDGGTWHRNGFTRFNFVDYEYRIGVTQRYIILDTDDDQWGEAFYSISDAQNHIDRLESDFSFTPYTIYELTEV